MQAKIGYTAAMKPIPPTSFSGSVNVATVMSNIAAQMDVPFENNGVSVILNNPYLPGTAISQIAAAARAAHINWVLETESGPLAIWPKHGARGGSIPLYSPQTGLIGYPAYTNGGIAFRAIYTPGQDPKIGGLVQVASSLKPATGKWSPYRIEYNLDAQTPGGNWSMTVNCVSAKNATTPPLLG